MLDEGDRALRYPIAEALGKIGSEKGLEALTSLC